MKIKNKQPRRAMYAGIAGALARVVDGAVGLFAPERAHEMRKARVLSAALQAYEAAKLTRTNPAMPGGSADGEILQDLPRLRELSRGLTRDDATVASAVDIREQYIVGTGILPQPRCTPEETGLTQEQCDEWNRSCLEAFMRWAVDEADATRQGTFFDLQALVQRCVDADGEAIAHTVVGGDGMIACEIIDADRIVSPNEIDTPTIRSGVEIDKHGRPVAFHILPHHPDDWFIGAPVTAQPKRVEVEHNGISIVQHVFRRVRPGQTRGVPRIASAILCGRHLHHYLDSELIAARAASNISLWIQREASTTDADIFPVQESEVGQDGNYHETTRAGTVEYLNEGEKPIAFNPNRPGSQFEPFVVRILRMISGAMGLAYEMVAKDFGRMNLASNRGMRAECHRGFDIDRARVVFQFCRPWWGNVIRMKVGSGELKAPAKFLDKPAAFLRCVWVAPSYGMVDPMSDVQASVAEQKANLISPYDAAARNGQDAEHVVLERARFQKFVRKVESVAGLDKGELDTSAPGDTAPVPEEPMAPDEPPKKDEPAPPAKQPDEAIAR